MSSRLKPAFAAIALVVLTGVLYTRSLDDAPVYVAHDEIMFSLQAHSLATTGRDLTGQRMPLFFSEPDFKAGRDPISIYITAFLLKFLPFSEQTVRLPTALVGMIDVLAMWLLARLIFSRDLLAGVAAAFMALTPAHFIYSRMALSVAYPLPFTIAWLLFLFIYLERENLKALWAATTSLGAGIYSYLGFLAMTPVYVVLTAYAIFQKQRLQSIRPYVVAAAGFLLPLSLLVVWHILHPSRYADLIGSYRLYDPHLNPLQGAKDLSSYFSLGVRTGVYWTFFSPSFLFFSGDSSVVNSTGQAGIFLLPFLVLLPLGVYHVLRGRRTPFNVLILIGFATAPLAATLLATVEIRRAMVMIPFAVLIATFGLEHLMMRGRMSQVAAIVLLGLSVFQFGRFYGDYFGDYRTRSSVWFGGNVRGGVVDIIDRTREAGPTVYLSYGIPYIDLYWKFYSIKHGRTDLLARYVYYDPKLLDIAPLPAGTLLLTPIGEDRTETLVKSAGWKTAAVISEPDGQPSFTLYEK